MTRIDGGIGFPHDAKEGGIRTTTQPLYTSTQTYPPIINFFIKKSQFGHSQIFVYDLLIGT
jgi:hypothetical protein